MNAASAAQYSHEGALNYVLGYKRRERGPVLARERKIVVAAVRDVDEPLVARARCVVRAARFTRIDQ